MAKQREEMIVGKKYPGYGWINDFKEFFFEPEQTGSRAGSIKAICTIDGVHVSETKNLIMVKFNIPKQSSKSAYYQQLARVTNIFTKILKDYDF